MDIVNVPGLGLRFEIRSRSDELLEFDAVGRTRGFITQYHVHTKQSEHFEVIEGTLKLVVDGREHLLGPGEIRWRYRPARRTARSRATREKGAWRVQVARTGGPYRGVPGAAGRAAAQPPGLSEAAQRHRAVTPRFRESRPTFPRLPSREYVFVDEWTVDAPRESVFAAIADARSYPTWWKPVYLSSGIRG